MKTNLKTMLLPVGISLFVSVSSALAHTDVTAEQAKELIDTTIDLTVIDVREPSEYSGARGHIPGALNYPWNSGVLQVRYEELQTDTPILVVCGSGGRSNRAANLLDSNGFSMVYDMLGGMGVWMWETVIGNEPYNKYGGGTGELNDPYLIYTAEQLNAIGTEPNDWDRNFKLMADIDLSDYIETDFNIIGIYLSGGVGKMPFTGVFDGNGHTISNFSYASENTGSAGLFGFVTGIVKDLILTDPNIDAGTEIGVGSLVGLLSDSGTVFNCCAVGGSVWGNEDVGGLVGTNHYGSTITDCYCTVNVLGTRSVGGLVGTNRSTIANCYAAGNVLANENAGGLVGIHLDGIITSSFWNSETSGLSISAGGTDKSTAEMQTASTFLEAGWDFAGESDNGTEDIWIICEGTNYPRFVWQISVGDFVCPDGVTRDDFIYLMEHWLDENCDPSNDFCQGTDLDQSGTVDKDDLEIFFESWLADK